MPSDTRNGNNRCTGRKAFRPSHNPSGLRCRPRAHYTSLLVSYNLPPRLSLLDLWQVYHAIVNKSQGYYEDFMIFPLAFFKAAILSCLKLGSDGQNQSKQIYQGGDDQNDG